MRHWLVKSEPDVYSIEDLARDGQTCWEGIRNYQSRNTMRDDMKLGDLVLFYHSRAKPPGVAGLARVVREAYPDHHALDPEHDYYDPKATEADPRWVMVDLGHVETFPRLVSLQELKEDPDLDGLLVAKRGQRLSIMPVEPGHFETICALGRQQP